MAQQDRPRLTI